GCPMRLRPGTLPRAVPHPDFEGPRTSSVGQLPFVDQARNQFFERHRAEFLGAAPQRDRTRFGLFATDHGEVRVTERARAADLGAELLRAEVGDRAHPRAAQLLQNFARVVFELLTDCKQANLLGRQPHWELAGSVLKVNSEEALE